MKIWICFYLLLLSTCYTAYSAPTQGVDPNLKRFVHELYDDSQKFSFQTNDGHTRKETTYWDAETGNIVTTGWYQYLAPDGKYYTVQYLADENGFQPRGAHLPGADPNPALYGISEPFAGGISKTVLLSLVG